MSSDLIACNLAVFDDDERQRYDALRQQLHSSFELVEELPDGFACQLSAEGPGLHMAAEFMSLERRCCPFLELELHAKGDGPVLLRFKGSDEMKALLRKQFAPLIA